MVDQYGRVATDLRVSLTDRCSLRCAYCMPPEGLPWLPRAELLSDDEIVRLVRIAVSLGVTEVRLTGGEPLLRPGVPDLVRRLAALQPRPELSLTTNGLLLSRDAAALAAAGLDRVKVNAVLLRGVNDDEAVPLLRWSLEEGYALRFIEQMPLDPQHSWDRTRMITADEVLSALSAAF